MLSGNLVNASVQNKLSTPFHKYDHVCCVAFRFWLGATREHPPSRPVGMTEEQQRQNRKATHPCGRRFFSAQTSLLAPYRPLKGMRVARASSGPKIPRRKRGRIYEMEYLAGALLGAEACRNDLTRKAPAQIW